MSIRKTMALSKKKSQQNSPRDASASRVTATLRSTSGAGFDFEDLISAWQLLKALSGEQVLGIGGVATQVQAQVSTLGWRIDDLLLTVHAAGAPRRLAISAKGNLQVTAAGLPADFVTRSWEQWRDPHGPFSRATDGLALVTLDTHHEFNSAWREVKNACNGSDKALAMSRIRSNTRQSRVFDSVQNPGCGSDDETIELIRCLHVLPTDLQLAHSENEIHSITQCRRLLASGLDDEAQALWKCLIDVAKGVRLRSGTITLPDLLSLLRSQFSLRHHPDFQRDWETLSNITADYKARIQTELPSGYVVPRVEEKTSLQAAIADRPVTVVFGESGSGKSALVKSVLDGVYPSWGQVWFGPEDLKTALSAARRSALPLAHELSQVLNATVKRRNVLVIDSAEHIESGESVVVRQLLQAILLNDREETERAWRVVIVTQAQTQSLFNVEQTMLVGWEAQLVEVETLKRDAVQLMLLSSGHLAWLAAHDETIAALTNLRTLAWVIRAGAAMGSNAGGLASHTAIADHLWKYWTNNRADVQALMMRLAQREAAFERSFALTDLEPADAVTFTQRPDQLPLRQNERTNRIEFEHDLAADWARFQFLKQIWVDTPKWAALASNPLWTNALQMLGQFLLRQQASTGTAWDVAFAAAEGAKKELAGNILLDALCLDPSAELFLAERVDLLLDNEAKHFTRLLLRFHHIATVSSAGGIGLSAVIGLYMEAQYRSIVFGRWPPVLRFLITHRERLAGLVSSALAKVIETWLTKTPRILSNGTQMPFRKELVEIALAMARTVQVEKGHGVMYLTREPGLYAALMAGADDLPTEVGNWALELAGRREVDADVRRRITEAQLKKAKAHAERIKTDAKYMAQHEKLKEMPISLGLSRVLLPPWPLGAKVKIDRDFRTACIKERGIQYLMRAQPALAAEVLLALIIDEQPEQRSEYCRFEMELGLQYAEDAYPTAFWKSPFFPFLQLAPEDALTSLIALVNFCTERWAADVRKEQTSEAFGVTLQFADGTERTFPGWRQVFGWPQSNERKNGSLFCALDALERWLTQRLDAGDSVTADFEAMLCEGNSLALVSVLVNVAKYRPSLLKGPLAALLTFPNLFSWDSARVEHVEDNFVAWSWPRGDETMFKFARDWTLAPHRKQRFVDVVVELLKFDDGIARCLQEMLPTWALPKDPKAALEFKLLFATLDRSNYQTVKDQATGAETLVFVCPNALSLEMQSWDTDIPPTLKYLFVPDHCEKLIRRGHPLTDHEATYLFHLVQECEAGRGGIEGDWKSKARFAAAGTLVALGGAWLAQNSEAQEHVLGVVRGCVAAVGSTAEEARAQRTGTHSVLKFVANAVMQMWLADGDGDKEWETAVLRLLTSGDKPAAEVVVGVAFANREQLGASWWRLLRVGLFWSSLVKLCPHHGDGGNAEKAWTIWLARLRRFPLHGHSATLDELDFKRVVACRERLDFRRQMRLYNSDDRGWFGRPERMRGGSLDGQVLEVLFHWLIDGSGTGNRDIDTRLALRIWDYDVTRAKANERGAYGEYDLPSQSLGYDILLKLGALAISAPAGEDRAVWEPVLAHGPAAHHALQHFIRGLFQRLRRGDDPIAFERVWRAVAEYGLAADWSQRGLWFHGERLICDLLGFGSEDALTKLPPGTILRMKDLYKRWFDEHLARDEDCVTLFCRFLTTDFGVPLRHDGLGWLAAILIERKPSDHWCREGTAEALIDLVASTLSSDALGLSQSAQARKALVEIGAAIAVLNSPAALTLQERIRQLRWI